MSQDFRIQAYRQKELIIIYGVTWKTWVKWLKKIPDLGTYDGKAYTPAQVNKIVTHIGPP
ncbi:MAG: hypothetical protein ACXVIY_00935 [Mucilaginibacter sp.]